MAGDVLAIEGLGPQGDGIHDDKGGRVYVDRALPGDTVRANLRRGDDGVMRGEVIEVVTPSPDRVAPPCSHYDVCGGCTMQHASEAFYRGWKVEIVRDALRKKGLNARLWRDPIFVPGGTRRRATFAAYKKNTRVTLGYYRRRSHQVADIKTCLVAAPALMELRGKLAPLLSPILQDSKALDVFVQLVGGKVEIALTGAVGKKGKPDLPVREAIAALAREAKIARVAWRPREKGERDDVEVILEIEPVRARFGALEVALPPLAFLQPTQPGEAALVDAVMELLPASGKFADLYCGCGTFSGPMLARGPVDAFDTTEPAIRALNKAKRDLPLRATRRDLDRDPLEREEANRYDAIVFDPPRAGAAAQAKALAASKVPVIVAVSCNPATFARDARMLVDGGYRLDSVKVIDQFTWSHHVELVAGFAKAR